ncbi:MAG: MFS transporter [Thermodesulfobacteriota bacterium]
MPPLNHHSPDHAERLWTPHFLALNLIYFLALANMAVFFHFVRFLDGLGFDHDQAGLIVGSFAFIGLILRPLVSPLMGPGNARRYLFWSTLATVASLLAYPLVQGFAGWLLLRLVHGAAYITMATAATAALVGVIPPARSAQAFGVFGVVTLLPYAVIPPFLEPLERLAGGYTQLLAVTGLAMLGILPLLVLLAPPGGAARQSQPGRLGWAELRQNFRLPGIALCLSLSLAAYCAFAALFYFIEPAARDRGLSGVVGLFFAVNTAAEIATRLFLGRFLDRVRKGLALGLSLALVAVCFVLLAMVSGQWELLALGVGFGLGWGVAMPLFNSVLFDLSPPRLRAVNANLGMEMFSGGFFLGPGLAGFLTQHWGFAPLFLACAGSCLAAGGLALGLRPAAGGESRERDKGVGE